MLARLAPRLLLLAAIVATIACDRATKQVATETLAGSPGRSFLADTVRLEYVENSGAFLGLGAEWPAPVRTALFTVGNALLLLVVSVMAARSQWPASAVFGTALLVAGGASNLVDRIAYGRVIDFMNVGLGPLRTGIFNVADMAILLGAGLVAFATYRTSDN